MEQKLVYNYIDDIARRLYDASKYGAASLMVGAGFSRNAISINGQGSSPNWQELAEALYEELYHKPDVTQELEDWEVQKIKKTAGRNILKLASEYESIFGKTKLNKLIETQINDDKYEPGTLHTKLLELDWRDVFTTNYDTLLEKSVYKIDKERNYRIIQSHGDLPGSVPPRIIKLHGSIGSRDMPYIMSEEDYRTYPSKYAPLVNTVQQAMLETQLCLIGFSGDDPNFLSWLGWLRDNMGDNCPPIYLIGLFYDMSKSERKTIESQNIVIVDLAELFREDEIGSHEEAINKFIGELETRIEEYGKLFKEVPYMHIFDGEDFYKKVEADKRMDDEYFLAMNDYFIASYNETKSLLFFPFELVYVTLLDLTKHFYHLLNKIPSMQQIRTLSQITYIFRKCSHYLNNYDERRLANVVNSQEIMKNNFSEEIFNNWAMLVLYLLEKYRIESRNDDYLELLNSVDITLSTLPPGFTSKIKEEIQIERCKFLIENFNYDEAYREIIKIDHDTAIDIQLKKIFLFKQLGEDEKGRELLRVATARLAQYRISRDSMASLRGYLNLCVKALLNNPIEIRDKKYSDMDYYANYFNIRKIFNELKDEVSNNLLQVSGDKRGENINFNPGSSTISYGIGGGFGAGLADSSWRYIMFQDFLCIPNTFAQHKETLALAIVNFSQSANYHHWYWSTIIRTNDRKVIDSFLTREVILAAGDNYVEHLYNQIFALLDYFDSHDNYNRKYKILNQETIYDLLSRLSIVISDDKIVELCCKALGVAQNAHEARHNEFIGVFEKMKHSINTNVLKELIKDLLEIKNIPVEIMFCFIPSGRRPSNIEISQKLVEDVIKDLRSKELPTRSLAMGKFLLLSSLMDLEKYDNEIAEALWSIRDEFGFPRMSENYYKSTWSKLPYPQGLDIESLYLAFLATPDFDRSVHSDGVISGNSDADQDIDIYIDCFDHITDIYGKSSERPEIIWPEDYFVKTVKYIHDYIYSERALLSFDYDLLGTGARARKRFQKLSNFVAKIIIQAHLVGELSSELVTEVERLKELLHIHQIRIEPIELVERAIRKNNLEEELNQLENRIIVGDKDEIEQVMEELNLLMICENRAIIQTLVSNKILKIFNSIKYMETKSYNFVLAGLMELFDYPIFVEEDYREELVRIFQENMSKLKIAYNESDREIIEAQYRLSVMIKRYYINLEEAGLIIPAKLHQIAYEFTQSKLKEVRHPWENVVEG